MPRVKPFDENSGRYDRWFENNRWAYESELEAVRSLLPESGRGVEIGVGTGRFAVPLGIRTGIEPSDAMREVARARGIDAVYGVAELLPWKDCSFHFALMVTTICFVDSIEESFAEAFRILRPGGSLIVGFVDRESPLGEVYLREKKDNVFYRLATFYSTEEVVSHLTSLGFTGLAFAQTVFHPPASLKEVEPVMEGHGDGSFVVVRATRPEI